MKNDLCNQCGECCRNIPVDFDTDILYFDGIQKLSDDFREMLIPVRTVDNVTICSCKYLLHNLCNNSNKPDICKNFPSSEFAFLQENCGYAGEIFVKNEQIKQKIRRYKEEIIHYSALIETIKNKKEQKLYQRIISSLQHNIDRYKQYGSYDW